jgi:hypothetical protein
LISRKEEENKKKEKQTTKLLSKQIKMGGGRGVYCMIRLME